MLHQLPATPDTVHWGYFDRDLSPVLRVHSGDLIEIETLTGHAGEAPDLMLDAGLSSVYERVVDRGPGPHIMTGPIWVDGAEPGDVLEARILEILPRCRFGSNVAGSWGSLYEEFGCRERITIYRLDVELGRASALFGFDHPYQPSRPGLTIEPQQATREKVLSAITVPLRLHFGCAGVAPPGYRHAVNRKRICPDPKVARQTIRAKVEAGARSTRRTRASCRPRKRGVAQEL